MISARDIIQRALRRLGVVAVDEPMTADMAASGLDAFNDMIWGWKAEGIDLGQFEFELATPWSLGREYVEAAVTLLAERLAPDYGVAGPDGTAARATLAKAALCDETVAIDRGLLFCRSVR